MADELTLEERVTAIESVLNVLVDLTFFAVANRDGEEETFLRDASAASAIETITALGAERPDDAALQARLRRIADRIQRYLEPRPSS